MKSKIEEMRDVLHEEMESKDRDNEKILKISKELDHLIISFHKQNIQIKNK